jgi:hypothetical protein
MKKLILVSLLLSGCAFSQHDLTQPLVPDPGRTPCEQLAEWKLATPTEMRRYGCGGLACTVGCSVISIYSEEEARVMPYPGEGTLWKHEEQHWRYALIHPAYEGVAK